MKPYFFVFLVFPTCLIGPSVSPRSLSTAAIFVYVLQCFSGF